MGMGQQIDFQNFRFITIFSHLNGTILTLWGGPTNNILILSRVNKLKVDIMGR